MADQVVPVTPATQAPAATPVPLRMANSPNDSGVSVVTQAVYLVNDQGRVMTPMTEETGQDILAAIKELHTCLARFTGDLAPSTRGISPPSLN